MEVIDPLSNDRILKIVDRYKISPSFFDKYKIVKFNTTYLHLVPKKVFFDSKLRVHTAGIPLFKARQNEPKIMTNAAPYFTEFASDHIIRIKESSLADYMAGRSFQIEGTQSFKTGYLLANYQNRIIGSALLRRNEKGDTIESQWPKQFRNIQLY